jgi:hypothetical protein
MENKRNLYLLPTDKGQRITKTSKGTLLWCSKSAEDFIEIRKGYLGFHLYITSDEEIKEGDWPINLSTNEIEKASKNLSIKWLNKATNWKNGWGGIRKQYQKIILTTDQDLIKDGVQAIDDNFLEWFVKNPSCEWVEIKMENYYASGALQPNLWQYKIIIPQEEPKQETTIEKAAEKYAKTAEGIDIPYQNGLYYGFVEGAKWQAERMYSEDDLRSAYRWGTLVNQGTKEHFKEWFEQFKKK